MLFTLIIPVQDNVVLALVEVRKDLDEKHRVLSIVHARDSVQHSTISTPIFADTLSVVYTLCSTDMKLEVRYVSLQNYRMSIHRCVSILSYRMSAHRGVSILSYRMSTCRCVSILSYKMSTCRQGCCWLLGCLVQFCHPLFTYSLIVVSEQGGL